MTIYLFFVVFTGEEPNFLANIVKLRSFLAHIIEPDFGLLDELLSVGVISCDELTDVCAERMVCSRNEAVLDLLTSQDQCSKFMNALLRTDQEHVISFISQNGGKIIIIIIKGIYRVQDRPKATSALCQQWNCQLFTCQPSTYYQQLNRNVFSCVLKVSTETSVDRSDAGRLFHVDGPQAAKLLSP